MPILVITMADLRDHDEPIRVITMRRSWRSRSAGARTARVGHATVREGEHDRDRQPDHHLMGGIFGDEMIAAARARPHLAPGRVLVMRRQLPPAADEASWAPRFSQDNH
jgi:hypothetical protein